MPPSTGQAVKYDIYKAADSDEVAILLGATFAHRDPPAVAAGVTPDEFERFVRLLLPNAADQGLTIVARSAETGAMCGALLTEDSATPMPEGLDRLGEKFDPIFDLLGPLDAEYRAGRPAQPGESLHLFLLGVAMDYAGRGIAQGLVEACLANGASRGYRMAVTEATNTTSQHIFRKHGFVERVRASYGEHRYQGRAVFASIAEQGGPILMDRQLDAAPATS